MLCDRYLYDYNKDYRSVKDGKLKIRLKWFQGKFKKNKNMEAWTLEGTETNVNRGIWVMIVVLLIQLTLTSVAMSYVAEFSENERVFDLGMKFYEHNNAHR